MSATVTKFLRFLPLTYKTVAPRLMIDPAKFVTFPPGFHGTNPSFVAVGDNYLVCVRGVNHIYVSTKIKIPPAFTIGDSYRTVNRFVLLDRSFALVRTLPALDSAFDDLEDVRLFRVGDEIMATATGADPARGPESRSIALLTIDATYSRGDVRIIASPYDARYEKNWAPFVLDGELHFVYSFEPLVLLRYDRATGRVVFASPRFSNIPAGELRFLIAGSSAGMPVEGGFLFAAHRRKWSIPQRDVSYLNRMYFLDATTLEVQAGPYFAIQELAIQYVNGLAVDGDDLVVSYGVMDTTAHLCRIARSDVEGGARLRKKA